MWAAPKGNVARDAGLLRGLLGLRAAQADQERPDWFLQNLKPRAQKKELVLCLGALDASRTSGLHIKLLHLPI